MEGKAPISLSDEVIQRVTAEEILRFDIQSRLKKKDTDGSDSKAVKFLNSPFGLFLLGAIFISGIGGLFQLWNDRSKHEEIQRDAQRKALAEYRWRLAELDQRIVEIQKTTDVEIKGVDTIMIYRASYGAIEFQPTLPEFKNESWAGVITQLDTLGVSENAAQAIIATKELIDGPIAGHDTNNRGYFAPGYLEERAKVLHLYYDSAHKKIFQ
jgi:hypothetical protein